MEELKMNHAMVGFIDVLGFSSRLTSAAHNEDLIKIYGEMKSVHRIFEKELDDQTAMDAHKAMAKSVISLSDALVVSVDFDSDFASCTPKLDVQAIVLSDLARQQAEAVMNGIFIRGGVALGYYYREQDIILSDALVRAYETENCTCMPVIGLDYRFYNSFASNPDTNDYAPESMPKNMIECFVNPRTGCTVHFVDYFSVAVSSFSDFYCDEDNDAYKATDDCREKQRILNESCTRSELKFVDAHAQSVRIELAKKHPKPIQDKYEWLKDFHNRSVDKFGYGEEHKI